MSEIERRLVALERAMDRESTQIPAEQRWWVALAETPAERELLATEPATWAEVEADWWAAAEAI